MPYYIDDGTEFDPNDTPIPELCLKCRKNDIHNGDEEILCNLTRSDQSEEENFCCHAFQPIVD